jgi:hypothetical protein
MRTIKKAQWYRYHKSYESLGRQGHACLQLILILPLALLLQGCLGGESDSGSGNNASEPDFITWVDNSNGSVILDYNNEHFAVLPSRALVYLAPAGEYVAINNAAVSTRGELFIDSNSFGQVSLVPGSGGGAVAALVWIDTDSKAYYIDVQRSDARTFLFYRTNAQASAQSGNGGNAGSGGSVFASATRINAPGLVSGSIRQSGQLAYSFISPQSGSYTVTLNFSQYSDLDLTVYNAQYTEMARSAASRGGTESVTVRLNAGSRYYALVSAYQVSAQSGQQSFDLQVRGASSGLSMPMASQPGSVVVSETEAKTPVSEVSVRTNCDADETLELQFSNTDRTAFWPGKGDRYVLNGPARFSLACAAGEYLCYGAKTQGGGYAWGLDELGGGGCTNCCFACDTPTDIALTCD